MKTMPPSRYVEALVKTIFLFGVVHLAVLAYVALQGDVQALNAFAILNLDFLFPHLGDGMLNFLLSYCIVLGVYGGVCLCIARGSRKQRRMPPARHGAAVLRHGGNSEPSGPWPPSSQGN